MKAPDAESGINKDFTEKSTDWIAATAGKRCTDASTHLVFHLLIDAGLMATVFLPNFSTST